MIGARLAEIRRENKETQADLAKRLNVSLPTVRAWEQDRSSPSHEMLVDICKMYHVSADYLLGLESYDRKHVSYGNVLDQTEQLKLKEYERFLIWCKKNNKDF